MSEKPGNPQSNKPLAGIRVIDFTRIFSGPYCAMLLADLGAEVVKVELPGEGDPLRRQGPPFHHGMGLTFLATNRNKRSITLDMKHPKGRELAYQLCCEADVVLENFRPDVMPKLGLGYEQLKQANGKLIYASISGLGADGPDKNEGAFDLTIQALGGYMSITGERNGQPIKLGTSAFDIVAGMNCYAGVLAALYQRTFTGQGQKVETSLLEGEVAFLTNAALEYLITGESPGKWGSEHSQQVPYKAFEAADGWIVIGAGYQNLWEEFVKVLGAEELLDDPRFSTLSLRVQNREVLYGILDAEVKKHSAADLDTWLRAVKVPCALVNDMEAVFNHRQVLHREMLRTVEHPKYGELPQVGAATKFSAFDVASDWSAPPLLGEHNAQILSEWLNMSADTIQTLASEKVI